MYFIKCFFCIYCYDHVILLTFYVMDFKTFLNCIKSYHNSNKSFRHIHRFLWYFQTTILVNQLCGKKKTTQSFWFVASSNLCGINTLSISSYKVPNELTERGAGRNSLQLSLVNWYKPPPAHHYFQVYFWRGIFQ